jgi:hypothetical protein
MRPRAEVAVTIGILTVVFIGVALLAGDREVGPEFEEVSTFRATPGGAQGLFEAVRGLGIGTRRYRGRAIDLAATRDSSRRQLFMLIAPDGLSPTERTALLEYSMRSSMLLAGPSAGDLMECFGFSVARPRDSVSNWSGAMRTFRNLVRIDTLQAIRPGDPVAARSPWVGSVLRRKFERTVVDSSRTMDVAPFSCTVPIFSRVDTLLVTTKGDLVALRLQRTPGGPWVYLVADEDLFRNRSLRDTDAGLFVLGWLSGQHDEVIFDERHHGYGTEGSLGKYVMAWSRASPWGWLFWQATIVGLLVLLFRIVRFGPIRPGFNRTRRSSLEHVRALATALSAAHGHDEAIAAMIRGLRRRLVPAGARSRGDWREWLSEMHQHAGTAKAKALTADLITLSQPGQPSASVYRTANTVEDLWTELRP